MAGIEDITPSIEIVGADEAAAALRNIGEVGAEAFANIARAAAQGDFTGLATLVGGEVAGSFTEAAKAILEFVDAQAHAAEVLSSLANATGMTVPEIEGLKDAFASVGISTNGFERAIGRLAITIGQEWSNIQQQVRTSAESQQNAMIGVQEAALRTEKAYRALQEASGNAADQARKDAQGITDAKFALERATLNQQKSQGIDTSAQEKQMKIDEEANAITKARAALYDANKKAAEDEAKAVEDMKQKILDVQKAQVAQAEAAEKAHEADLKDLPKIAAQIDQVAKGTMEWKDVSNSAELSAANIQKALVLASGQNAGGVPNAKSVLMELSGLFEHMGSTAEEMNVKMELVQKTMGAGFRAGQASAAQLLAVLDRGPEALEAFTKEADKFSHSGIGFDPTKGMDVDKLKEFNAAWSSLDAILDQVKGHFAALIAPGLTEMFNSIKTSIEDSDGALHHFLEAMQSIIQVAGQIGSAIGTLIGLISNFASVVLAAFNISAPQAWIVVIGALIAAVGGIPAVILLVIAAIADVAAHWDEVWDGMKAAAQAVADYIANSWIGQVVGAINKAIQAASSLVSSLAKGSQSSGSQTSPDTDQPKFDVQGKARGGPIRGPGGATDDRAGLFALSDGEFVVRTAAVQAYGVDLFHALNNLAVGGFADGGAVHVAGVSGAGNAGPSSILNLTIDGHKFDGLRAPADTAKNLKMYAVGRQSASTGNKPSWMR